MLVLWCSAAAAAPRTYAVEVGPPGWRADAIAIALDHDLADDRLVAGDHADLVVHVELDDHALRYDVRATWPGAPAPAAGALALGGSRGDRGRAARRAAPARAHDAR